MMYCRVNQRILAGSVLPPLLLVAPVTKTVEVLTAQELAAHCDLLKVDLVAAGMQALADKAGNDESAMEVVYASLQQHFPCK